MDPKLHTFLTLCQTMNYRMAAERLHLSQPAVTKQIQALEQKFVISCLARYSATAVSPGKMTVCVSPCAKRCWLIYSAVLASISLALGRFTSGIITGSSVVMGGSVSLGSFSCGSVSVICFYLLSTSHIFKFALRIRNPLATLDGKCRKPLIYKAFCNGSTFSYRLSLHHFSWKIGSCKEFE